MNRLYELFKTPSGPSTGKALLNHTIFSPSQTGETVPLTLLIQRDMKIKLSSGGDCEKFILSHKYDKYDALLLSPNLSNHTTKGPKELVSLSH
jgi:hypothetical protein